MSRKITTPTNQKRLTNVVIVKLKKGGNKFELACYPNKVQSYRDGIEKDLDEVLQIPQIFLNVSKGEVAKSKDLDKAFGKKKQEEIILEILKKGEIQVSEKEREIDTDKIYKDIATIISEKTVDPSTKKPIPVTMIEKAMKSNHYSIKTNKSAKQQALEVMKILIKEQKIPIERALMRIKIAVPSSISDDNSKSLNKFFKENESEETKENQKFIQGTIDPSVYREISDFLKNQIGKDTSIEVLNLAVTNQGESKLE